MNKYLSHEYFSYLNNSKRRFSTSSSKLSDIDDLLNRASKHREELEKFRKKLDEEKKEDQIKKEKEIEKLDQENKEETIEKENKVKTYLDLAKERVDELMNKQEKVEAKLIDRIDKGYEILSYKKGDDILDKFEDRRAKIQENVHKKASGLESEFEGEIKSIAYLQKKTDIEASGFKKLTQILEKEEEEIDKELKKVSDYNLHKDTYEKKRSEWKEEHQENVRSCRQEKQDIKEHLVSNLDKASVMAEDLLAESGPEYGGGGGEE